LAVIGSYWLAVIGSYWQLLAVIGSYWQSLAVIGSYWQLLAVIGSYWPVIGSYLQLLAITTGSAVTGSYCGSSRNYGTLLLAVTIIGSDTYMIYDQHLRYTHTRQLNLLYI
jgi:hypothetical protein